MDGLLASGDHAGLVALMTRLYLDGESRAEMSSSARQRAMQFDIRSTAQTLLDWYEALISRGTEQRHDPIISGVMEDGVHE